MTSADPPPKGDLVEVRLAGQHRSIRNRLGLYCLALCWSRRQVWRASRFSARMASNLARSDTWS